MTPKEKAKDLYVKFSDYCSWNTFEEEQDYINNIKQCALIAVKEIIDALENNAANSKSWDFYEQVKKEIEAL